MNTVDKITRETKILIDSAKDTVASKLVEALKRNSIAVRDDQVASLISLVTLSVEQGYQKAIPTFQSSIKKHIA